MDSELLGRISQSASRPIRTASAPSGSAASDVSFASVLQQTVSQQSTPSLHFSAHAQLRMSTRGLTLTSADKTRIGQAVGAAATKGAKDAYICYGDMGFVVNVPNRTVITAMTHTDQTVVTNVDSVVVVPRPDQTGGRAAGTD
ncbi:hypothetical protein JI721_00390 [Alicyclobacillus cycloheptanicus]|uniref:Flagellar operon protein n=1 Tax=Alicyclobacillus cycloheptanicus TaxID=1457 RepID=A0ABT9XJR7_9BACL|nr:hypothetical protein [Alicyclobacillus cycloheptanicus]MDQ0190553.1 flagellar operon protein [Alicyclobacillus cycloheptanicus]WDM01395.1 hypothetical protein JI721_00390 [Alicyclobacillus cycloheptanicus]